MGRPGGGRASARRPAPRCRRPPPALAGRDRYSTSSRRPGKSPRVPAATRFRSRDDSREAEKGAGRAGAWWRRGLGAGPGLAGRWAREGDGAGWEPGTGCGPVTKVPIQIIHGAADSVLSAGQKPRLHGGQWEEAENRHINIGQFSPAKCACKGCVRFQRRMWGCLLYTSDAADEDSPV